MSAEPNSVKKLIWKNIIFFSITTLVGIIGTPIYIAKYGLSPTVIGLFVFYLVATGMGITVGYHRHFSHATYKANPVIQFLLLFFGAASFEQSALDWSSQHRDHHRFVDTDNDPYSIKKGFFYAHIGWLIFWKHKFNYENAKDLQKNKMVMNQAKYFDLWAIFSGILVPVFIGALTGHALGTFIIAVCLRLTIVYHATFCINSVCHMFGKSTYDIYATARDHWLVALITYGEGYHNFHHRFPSDYRNGVRWYQWDPSKWMIASLAKLGWVWDLKTVSKFKIIEARLAGEKRRANDLLEKALQRPQLDSALEALILRYSNIKGNLAKWEEAAREYQDVLRTQMTDRSNALKQSASVKLKQARSQFRSAYHAWSDLVERNPVDLYKVLNLAPIG